MAKKITEEDFIARSVSKHGDKYNYKNVDYINTTTKVQIGCSECQTSFNMTPESHMLGQGCRACGYARNGKNKQSSFEDFLIKAAEAHGDKFDYSRVVWGGNKKSIRLYCPVHKEDFITTPSYHAAGSDCPRCAKVTGGMKQRSTTEKFINDVRKKFGDKFSFEATIYVKSNAKLKIRCTLHDYIYEVTPNCLLRHEGNCTVCQSEIVGNRNRISQEDFIASAKNKHGDRYNYENTVYVESKAYVDIECKEHGNFRKKPHDHLSGQGCPKCANYGYRQHLPGHLYIFSDDELTKVGITNKNPEVRRKFVSKSSNRNFNILHSYHFEDGAIPLTIETQILKELWADSKSPDDKFSGSTECFYEVDRTALIINIEKLIQEHKDAHQPQQSF